MGVDRLRFETTRHYFQRYRLLVAVTVELVVILLGFFIAPAARRIPAQGNPLGLVRLNIPSALKGRRQSEPLPSLNAFALLC